MSEQPQVFISYSHDTPEHKASVLALADALRTDGIDIHLDQYIHPEPAEGSALWTDLEIDQAEFVVIVCTPTYRRRAMGQEESGQGLGVRWEGGLIYNRLYQDGPSGPRFIPVLLEGMKPADIPNPLQRNSFYQIGVLDFSDPGYEGLYRHLTDQPPTPPPPIGTRRVLGPRFRVEPLPRSMSTPAPEPMPESISASREYQRSQMLEKVWTIWIAGYLQSSLGQGTGILLDLKDSPDSVTRSFDALVHRPAPGERPVRSGQRIVDVFREMGESLLILGGPGSGKTTLLLELARDLIDEASADADQPIPIVFPLSTWAKSRRPLVEWLVDELSRQYEIPKEIGEAWIKADRVLPLLDGLDEVDQAHRPACVKAINAFREKHGLLAMVVSCREYDYQALATNLKLRLHGAVVVQPLTKFQEDAYLASAGSAGKEVREAISQDPSLYELLATPLMLYVASVAYAEGRDRAAPRLAAGSLEARRESLFAAYVDEAFRRRGVSEAFSQGHTVAFLIWLAQRMRKSHDAVFYPRAGSSPRR